MKSILLWSSVLFLCAPSLAIQDTDEAEEDKGKLVSSTFSGLKFRSIGPAFASGRVGDFAVDPRDRAHYYAAVCSGGVWETKNAGTTWKPIFDGEGSYSIGCITMDPQNPHTLWVGTGENNSQRSVSFGDGVYRSRDGGKNWENVGLKESEHIGMIVVHPEDSDTVYVAAQGPLWSDGGDRGLYRTKNGGTDWEKILEISDQTGVNEVHMDPRDPDVLYASSYQRRRRVWTLINGGPESAIYKSTDGGDSWRKLETGLPKVDMGRIGLDISPADPDVVYAIIEAAQDKGGVFRSTDRGETWDKRSDHMTSSPQYYNEILCDPKDVDRVYSLDTFLNVTEDGGKSFQRVPNEFRHVDDHALWIDPQNTDYLLVGCDGGVYESFDRGANWEFKDNLPITQFYRVSVDESSPFYYVYGGTQDNNSMGGPSRTLSRAGITNEDWFVTVGGDGYETVIDPVDPNIVYSQWQYGGLVRFDRKSGETVDIKPREPAGGEAYKWNWDSPLILSPHSHTRLYFAGNRLFRSDDRGDSWQVISEDLTRGLDRNQLPVMGRVWGVDTVAKNKSTSFYGNAVSLSESPLAEGLIYVGTDDGLIHVTSDGGAIWARFGDFPGVPEMSYVSRLEASTHDASTVYAAFDNHKSGDFKPYVLKSIDRGQSWTSIAGDLPERDTVYALGEDHADPNLLFCGTEFGVYFTVDGGQKWIRLKAGVPTIAVRDLALQRRENDLVLGTFGRSFYVLDDYSSLRGLDEAALEQEAALFEVKDAWLYVESSRLGGRTGRGSQGAGFYTAPNPPFGAVFTYYLKDKLETREELRRKAEKEAREAGEDVSYPSWEELRAEDRELEPGVSLAIRDESGQLVRRVEASREAGVQRVAWDLRYPTSTPIDLNQKEDPAPWVWKPRGPLALPGTYTATLEMRVDGVLTALAAPRSFEVVPLGLATLAAADRGAAMAFQSKVARLQRAAESAVRVVRETEKRIEHCRKAVLETPDAEPSLLAEITRIGNELEGLKVTLSGDRTVSSRSEPTPPSVHARIRNVVGNQWYTTQAPTRTEVEAYAIAGGAFGPLLERLKSLVEGDLDRLEQMLEAARAPWTPGRLPEWTLE